MAVSRREFALSCYNELKLDPTKDRALMIAKKINNLRDKGGVPITKQDKDDIVSQLYDLIPRSENSVRKEENVQIMKLVTLIAQTLNSRY